MPVPPVTHPFGTWDIAGCCCCNINGNVPNVNCKLPPVDMSISVDYTGAGLPANNFAGVFTYQGNCIWTACNNLVTPFPTNPTILSHKFILNGNGGTLPGPGGIGWCTSLNCVGSVSTQSAVGYSFTCAPLNILLQLEVDAIPDSCFATITP